MLLVGLVIGAALGYVAGIWSLIRRAFGTAYEKIVGKVASGKFDPDDSVRIRKIINYLASDRALTPRIRVATQALIDRFEEPIPRADQAEEASQ